MTHYPAGDPAWNVFSMSERDVPSRASLQNLLGSHHGSFLPLLREYNRSFISSTGLRGPDLTQWGDSLHHEALFEMAHKFLEQGNGTTFWPDCNASPDPPVLRYSVDANQIKELVIQLFWRISQSLSNTDSAQRSRRTRDPSNQAAVTSRPGGTSRGNRQNNADATHQRGLSPEDPIDVDGQLPPGPPRVESSLHPSPSRYTSKTFKPIDGRSINDTDTAATNGGPSTLRASFPKRPVAPVAHMEADPYDVPSSPHSPPPSKESRAKGKQRATRAEPVLERAIHGEKRARQQQDSATVLSGRPVNGFENDPFANYTFGPGFSSRKRRQTSHPDFVPLGPEYILGTRSPTLSTSEADEPGLLREPKGTIGRHAENIFDEGHEPLEGPGGPGARNPETLPASPEPSPVLQCEPALAHEAERVQQLVPELWSSPKSDIYRDDSSFDLGTGPDDARERALPEREPAPEPESNPGHVFGDLHEDAPGNAPERSSENRIRHSIYQQPSMQQGPLSPASVIYSTRQSSWSLNKVWEPGFDILQAPLQDVINYMPLRDYFPRLDFVLLTPPENRYEAIVYLADENSFETAQYRFGRFIKMAQREASEAGNGASPVRCEIMIEPRNEMKER
ncbi:hypothetical protein AK830_g7947 [Neonectria ditissima]|uniref:Uncharacterized protein n=1 Tax=Neonectria ditissima TaxID=78410 RepID=A0A0P7AYK1_9HYPO|nr:hypothetical protein AK830_g7947 [Neonectria ditissima]